MLSRGVLASAPLRMGGAGTSGAHSLASSVVSLVFFIVSFVFASGVLARAFSRMRAAGAGRAHSLASCIVFSVFCIVSFVSISLVIMISEHTVATAVVNAGKACG